MSKQSAVQRAARAAAEFGDAADAVDDAAAAVFAVNRTDLRLISALRDGPLSAGRLAAAVQLSPAAATTAIQRLARRGYVTREPDPTDRRRAVVALTPQALRLIERLYGPVVEAGLATLRRWSAAELDLIADFLERGRALQLAEAERIRALAGGPGRVEEVVEDVVEEALVDGPREPSPPGGEDRERGRHRGGAPGRDQDGLP